ncbi:lambda-crystallin-like isoform X1 [Dysidea avara]|uniref:lambda-crystallin-like isoform X1 n=2 Tax=Dysidea avara TaxID=196820 RepID=UPI00331AFB1B
MAESSVTTNKGKVAIIGSGVIGKSWGLMFLRAGYEVVLFDTQMSQLKMAQGYISSELENMQKEDGCDASELIKKLTLTENLKEAMNGTIYVQECVPEIVELKKKVFTSLDEFASDKVIMASSTSCIPASSFTSDLKHKSQCIVSHPANPPLYVPVIEIIPSVHTSQEVVERTVDLMKELGKVPVVEKKELNGFVINRLQYAIIMEAWRLVEDGVCSPEDIDAAFTEGLGLRYAFVGPLETMHLNAGGIKDYCERYGANIKRVVTDEHTTARDLSGDTLAKLSEHYNKQTPLDKLEEKRQWRAEYHKELLKFKEEMKKKI